MERSQSRKQAKISFYNSDYIHQQGSMLANAVLRPERQHFQSHRSPKELLNYKFTTLQACNGSVLFYPLKDTQYFFCCKYQVHLQYMQKLECKCCLKPPMCQQRKFLSEWIKQMKYKYSGNSHKQNVILLLGSHILFMYPD